MIIKVLALNVRNIHCKSRDVYGMKVCDRKERLLDYACHLSGRLEICLVENRTKRKQVLWEKVRSLVKKFANMDLFQVSSDMSTNQ